MNAGGLITNIDDGTTARVYTYDAINQLTGENGGGTNAAWTYDAAGNCLTDMGSGVTNSAAYDVDNELLFWSTMAATQNTIRGQVAPGPQQIKWYNTWASAGGRSVRVSPTDGSFVMQGVPMAAGSNALAVTVRDFSGNVATKTVSFTKQAATGTFNYYDANGNLTNAANGASSVTYSYDFENRLTGVTSNGVSVLQCWYDGAGRRIAKREVVGGVTNSALYVYDGWTVLAVVDGATGQLLETYLRGSGLGGDIGTLVAETRFAGGTATNTVYCHNNHRGDVTAVRQGTSMVATFDYAAFGQMRSASGSYSPRFRFSSKELDSATGLYYYGYRYYAPSLNRWLTQDPIKEAGGLNQYVFCGNNVLNAIDIFGLRCCKRFTACFNKCLESVYGELYSVAFDMSFFSLPEVLRDIYAHLVEEIAQESIKNAGIAGAFEKNICAASAAANKAAATAKTLGALRRTLSIVSKATAVLGAAGSGIVVGAWAYCAGQCLAE